ncbi:MAG TPA: SusD/RagB family nutrient-binding outer membrane lipoprotein [Gemmatimonadaceae bacterium]
MRYHKLTHAATGLALALSASACDQGLTGLNDNPNAPTDVSAPFLFPQGVTALVGLTRGAGYDLTMTSLWAQHFAKIQYVDEDTYWIRSQSIDAYWNAFYSGGLQDLTLVIEKTADRPGLAGPAHVMKQWAFGQMTDTWGDIPYSEANQGAANITPAYDAQADIYAGILSTLNQANDMMATATEDYGSADPIYAGDLDNWQKFANSLRLRYAMRMSNVDEPTARAEIQAALAEAAGVFESNADNAMLQWPGDGTNDNPFYTNFRTRDDHRVSATMVDTLASLSDPRLAVYARPTQDPPNGYVGVPNALENPTLLGLTKTSKIGTAFSEQDSPSVLMHYAEVELILAEAAARGFAGVTGTAAEHYEAGIRASMEMYGIDEADIVAYLGQPEVQLGTGVGGDDLTKIALQKWIALYGQGIEAWAEWRRTGVPALEVGPAAIIDEVARRLTYPGTEQSFNGANLDAAVGSLDGGDDLTSRVWWDVP